MLQRPPVERRLLTRLLPSFLAYRTSQYKLHYYETATNVKFVMLTDTRSQDMQVAMREIYVRCYVEYGTSLTLVSVCQGVQWGLRCCGHSREESALAGGTSGWCRCQQRAVRGFT